MARREERKKGIKNVFEEILVENVPDLKKEIYLGTGITELQNKIGKQELDGPQSEQLILCCGQVLKIAGEMS